MPRTKGQKNKSPKFRHYSPKKWPPQFDEIVILSCKGLSNKELAIKYDYTLAQISNILCSDKADEVRKVVRAAINKHHVTDISERLANLQEKALKRVEDFLDSDHIFNKAPIEAVDRAFKMLSTLKILEDPAEKASVTVNNNTQTNNTLVVSGSDFQRMMKGAELSEGIPIFDPSKKITENLSVDHT